MGQFGPIPDRSDQRVRRNTTEYGEITKIDGSDLAPVRQPPLDIPDAHQMIVDFYRSLGKSAQAKFYEPSDWQYARFTLHWADQLLKSSKPSAQMLMAINSMLSALLVSEGDRRRVRIEVERNQTGAQTPVTDIAELFRQKMQQGARMA